jgi:hypothetical protein
MLTILNTGEFAGPRTPPDADPGATREGCIT